VNKAAANAAQLAKCIFLHAYSRTTASSQLCQHKQNFIQLIKQAKITDFGIKNN